MADEGSKRDATAEFLSAEEAARNLVTALESLKAETEGYVAAERSLSESGERIVRMADRLEELSRRSADALEIVRSAGGPQIIEELHAISPLLQRQGQSLASQGDLLGELKSESARSQGAIDSVRKELAEARLQQKTDAEGLVAVIRAAQWRILLMVGGVAALTLVVLILAIVLLIR